ncbi:MAG: glutamate racemase [Firmicutes bacterium]|nr:glutamate racemase [Bacillota bacterium]
MNRYKAIAMLDSGVGGLTVAQEIFRQLPAENVVYFGDTAHMPYGPRSPEQIRGFVYEISAFLQTQEVKALIIACNVATAAGLNYYAQKVDLPLLGVIEPAVRAALRHTKTGKIGVIGTAGTVKSGAYSRAFQRLAPEVELYSQACPLFVLIVENGLVNSPEARCVAQKYLQPLLAKGIDVLIMGCTHYPLLAGVVQEIVGPAVRLISSAEETARETKELLACRNLLRQENPAPQHRYFVSGPAKPFADLAATILRRKPNAYQVILPW